MLARYLPLLLAAAPAWVDAFVARYHPTPRARTLTAAQCSTVLSRARQLAGAEIEYDPAYFAIGYPGGDVPAGRGVCADVIDHIGGRPAEEDVLRAWHIIGHFSF